MKKIIIYITIFTIAGIFFSNISSVEAQNWRKIYIIALEKGKEVKYPEGKENQEGLAYTPPEDVVLEEAVTEALEQKAPPCECMKIAIDLEYNPYSVLKNIYGAGGEVALDQLCMCATEAGVMKAIIARAAMDAVSPLNEPVFEPDEINQSQCLGGEEGLAYTTADAPLNPIPVNPAGNPNYASTSSI